VILLVATSSLPLAAGPTPKFDDWVQFIIFAVVIVGSIISGLFNAARKKASQGNGRRVVLRRHIEAANRETGDEGESPFSGTPYERPVARPMPPPAPPVVSPMRPTGQSAADLVRMLREQIEAKARQQADAKRARNVTIEVRREPAREARRPAPPRQRPAPPSRQPVVTSLAPSSIPQRRITTASARVQVPVESRGSSLGDVRRLSTADEIDQREEAQDRSVERRIGSIGVHIRPSAGDVSVATTSSGLQLDRSSLRRAIMMNELLGPPLALRGLSADESWNTI